MKRKIFYIVLAILLLAAIDAISFTLSHVQMVKVQEKRLNTLFDMNTEALVAFLDDDNGDLTCTASKDCRDNTINARCSILACRADKAKCKGDYSSGECKDIKDEHEIACWGAKKGCGDTLPDHVVPPTYCSSWWDYRCRLALAIDAVFTR